MSAQQRVVAVFASDPKTSFRAVLHVRSGAPRTPVWLYSTAPVPSELADLCDRVTVLSSSWRLLSAAQRDLWPLRAALSVAMWTGGGESRLLKLAPFLVPPFRALFLNAAGDFLPGTPAPVAMHLRRLLRETIHDARIRAAEIVSHGWQVVSYHVWRSAPVNRAMDRTGAALLFVFATLLRTCGYPHRRLFHLLHGDAPLCPVVSGSCSREIVYVRQQGPDWNGAALRDIVRDNSARYLVWHQGARPDDIAELLPQFEDPGVFAVSRQSDYRAWKPVLLPTAPFRMLQAGERAQVFAPLGSAIVADLQKVAALGVPEVSHPITAWMLLFWKAAAAGWRSYSAGHDGPLHPQVDFPTEEAAFLLQVVKDGEARAIGPREPLLARGNIAFAANRRHSPARRGRLKVMVVSPFLPYPLSHGGAVRIYNLCRALRDRVDFTLVAVRESHEAVDYDKLHAVFDHVYVIDIDQTSPAPEEWPDAARHYECPSLRALISELCRSWQPDVVQFEYAQTAALRDSACGVPAILVEHDLNFILYRQFAETSPGRESRRNYDRWLRFERRWLAAYDAVWTVSEADRALALRTSERKSGVFSVPNGVDIERFLPGGVEAAQPEVLYVGSFRHLPNIIAFEFLRNTIMPLVWARFPNALLRVVAGPRHEYFWKRFGRGSESWRIEPRIHVHDFVEDLRPLYSRASVVTAPLEVSAGTNIKIMEAMACGKAIVSTPPGCAGLELANGRDLLVRRGAAEFAQAVCELLEDPSLRERIGAHARRTAEERFSWTSIAREAYASYLELVRNTSVVNSSRAHLAGR